LCRALFSFVFRLFFHFVFSFHLIFRFSRLFSALVCRFRKRAPAPPPARAVPAAGFRRRLVCVMHMRRSHDRELHSDVRPDLGDPHRSPLPRNTRLKFFVGMLLLHSLVMLSLHWGVLWYRAPPRASAVPLAVQARKLIGQLRSSRLPVDARSGPQRSGPQRRACAERLAVYYTPPPTQPRLEDFDFMVNALRVWKATQHAAVLVVLAEPGAASHKPLTRACQALSQCLERHVPSELRANATVERVVHAVLQSLPLVPARQCTPTAGVLLYAPGPGQLGASLDSRALFQYHERNASRCIDTQPHACMAFVWS
jgi:hypothetical protein